MIDRKALDKKTLQSLKELGYEEQVRIYDNLCASCPHSDIRIKSSCSKEMEKVSLEEAIEVICLDQTRKLSIYRGCNFGDNELNLYEIITNSCRFWTDKYTEVDNVEDCFIVLGEEK